MKFLRSQILKIIDPFIKLARRAVISDYKEYCSTIFPQRALLSYLVLPLLVPPPFRNRVKFSNLGIAQEIPRVLNELGYSVDILNFDNAKWSPQKKYDLFIGHGGINFENISRCVQKETIRIFFATGIYWKTFNQRVAKRYYDIALRKCRLLPPERFIIFSEEYAIQNAHAIITLGNEEAVETYSKYNKTFALNNAIYPLQKKNIILKDFERGRRNFLFFSGRGNVLKGLDLLIDAFSDLNLHLHICQHMERDFLTLYQDQIAKCPNIHIHGFVKMRSIRFHELIKECNWIISPSCAEGQPGAILECMGYGLIPILSAENNINLGKWGIRLESSEVDSIRAKAIEASIMEVEECRTRSGDVITEIMEKYSVKEFRANLKRAILNILGSFST
jgi:glycosyltransferase involved in cell wall biosynthesis